MCDGSLAEPLRRTVYEGLTGVAGRTGREPEHRRAGHRLGRGAGGQGLAVQDTESTGQGEGTHVGRPGPIIVGRLDLALRGRCCGYNAVASGGRSSTGSADNANPLIKS